MRKSNNVSLSHNAVCMTAPATPSMLINACLYLIFFFFLQKKNSTSRAQKQSRRKPAQKRTVRGKIGDIPTKYAVVV